MEEGEGRLFEGRLFERGVYSRGAYSKFKPIEGALIPTGCLFEGALIRGGANSRIYGIYRMSSL